MIYAVVVRVHSKDEQLADALAGVLGGVPRKVYVVGMSEESALAAALDDTLVMEIEDPNGVELLRFQFTETVGIEGQAGKTWGEKTYEELLALAKNRVALLQQKNPSPMARIAA